MTTFEKVVDSVADYVDYMKEIFDFGAIKSVLQGEGDKPALHVLINSMHGGMYVFNILSLRKGHI